MERLHFSSDVRYSALEAAIHLGRYAVAKSICPGKRVLDVACGEGYGSYQLAAWGAASVDGVDISAEAIEGARQRFSDPRISYHQSGVEALDSLFRGRDFDVIVSLETIEHLSDPEGFLASLRDRLAPGGTIVVSCPNDHWYYSEDQSNPFHLRKYRFAEYRELAERVLGPAVSWRMGTLTAGFVTVRLDAENLAAAPTDDQASMLRNRDVDAALLVPGPHDLKPTTEDCSFFVGVWGADVGEAASVTFPLSMEGSDRSLLGGEKIADLRAYIAKLQQELEQVSKNFLALDESSAQVRKYTLELESYTQSVRPELEAARELAGRNAALEESLGRSEAARKELEAALDERIREIGSLRSTAVSGDGSEELRRSLRQVSLRFHASQSENELLRARAREHLSRAEHEARVVAERDATIREIPWRVVGVYRKVRPLVPRRVLRGLASVIDISRRKP